MIDIFRSGTNSTKMLFSEMKAKMVDFFFIGTLGMYVDIDTCINILPITKKVIEQ